MALAAWTLFAFAGVLRWTTVPLVAGAAMLSLAVRPPIFKSPGLVLDGALVAWLLLASATLVPLPAPARVALAPGSRTVDSALYLDRVAGSDETPSRPLSIDPSATRWSLALGAALVLVFWCAREVAAVGGVRAIARGVAWIGLALAAIAIVQHGTAPDLLYWSIRPPGRAPRPFGPFVNRNDIATWLIMAIPLAMGYAVARVQSRRHAGTIDLTSALDATELWLAASVLFMLATLLVTTSRSGLMGAAAGLAGFMWLARRRMARTGMGWLVAIAATIVAAAATFASWSALTTRVEETISVGLGGRREIWDTTLAMAAEFRLTGVGVGAYERAMTVYQRQPHVFYFNHAHNEYLQMLAEGGVMLAVPAVLAAAGAAWRIWRALDADRSAIFWIRAGAASGLLAVAVQSIWDTGLRVPASAVLFSMLAGLALHEGP